VQSPQKIMFGEMSESGARGVLVYCSDYTTAAVAQNDGSAGLAEV